MVKMIKNLYTLIASNVETYGSNYMNRFIVRSVPEYKEREKKHGLANWPTVCSHCNELIDSSEMYGAIDDIFQHDYRDMHFACLLENIENEEINLNSELNIY